MHRHPSDDILSSPSHASTPTLDLVSLGRTLIAASLDGLHVFAVDRDGRFLQVGDALAQLLRRPAAQLLRSPVASLLSTHAWNQLPREQPSRFWQEATAAPVFLEFQPDAETTCPMQLWRTPLQTPDLGAGVAVVARTIDWHITPARPIDAAQHTLLLDRAASLSLGERQVVELAIDGHMNKAMARMLGVAVRTIEARRARAMQKLGVRSISELVRVWLVYRQLQDQQSTPRA